MGKRRKTAKTGDRDLYKRLAASQTATADVRDDDDNMYGDVDKYNDSYGDDVLKLDGGQSDDDEDESDDHEEAVMDLGVGGESDDDDDDDDDDSSGSEALPPRDDPAASSSSDDDEELEEESVTNWGQRKSAYYHGDTADLEIGQDGEDAFLEEEAVREVQASRYEEMEEEDFMLSDDDEESKVDNKERVTRLSSIRDISKLTKKERKRLLAKQQPGLVAMLSHFSGVVDELANTTGVAAKALFSGDQQDQQAIGATPMGKQYLATKALMQTSTALNLAVFLLIKSEEAKNKNDEESFADSSGVESHPVLNRLRQWTSMSDKLQNNVEGKIIGLEDQLNTLVKAHSLMNSGEVPSSDEDHSVDEDKEEEEEQLQSEDVQLAEQNDVDDEEENKDDDEEDEDADEDAIARNRLNDAKFGLRPNEVSMDSQKKVRRIATNAHDFGDEDGDADMGKTASRALSSTINRIEQRASSRGSRKTVVNVEALNDPMEQDDELRRGLEMMEAELGRESDNEMPAEEDLPEDVKDDDDGGFYGQVARSIKSKRNFKQTLYKPAPKFPRMESVVEGERKVGRMIMKNRGLVPHKNKLNRNPRVKKREQYRKALIRRKGAVREVRTEEGHQYGGESTGIKTRISRSRKLTR